MIDIVMTNEEGMVQKINYGEPIGRSDHVTMDWEFQCYVPDRVTKVKKYLYDKGNFDEIRASLTRSPAVAEGPRDAGVPVEIL